MCQHVNIETCVTCEEVHGPEDLVHRLPGPELGQMCWGIVAGPTVLAGRGHTHFPVKGCIHEEAHVRVFSRPPERGEGWAELYTHPPKNARGTYGRIIK